MKDIDVNNNEKRFTMQEGEYEFEIDGSKNGVIQRMLDREKSELLEAMKKPMPIGSVVTLYDDYNKYMIVGFNYNNGDTIKDYLGCRYPYGIDEENKTIGFNHSQIDRVYFIGYVNNHEKTFKNKLKEDNER